jgi:3-deoxy-D-manno-octulosonic-acid transferase
MNLLFTLFNLLLEAVFYLFYPLIYLYLASRNYLGAIRAEGEDSCKGIMIHAASVGEVNAVKPLIMKLLEKDDNVIVTITTSTVTGLKLANQISKRVRAFLSCVDVRHLRFKQLRRINPGIICVVETEIWLNMLDWASMNDVPLVFINARMSEKSLKAYGSLKPVLRKCGKSIQEIHAQSKDDCQRFAKVFDKPVYNSGNLKYALKLSDYNSAEIRLDWGFEDGDHIICWGSSRPGEEEIALNLLNHAKRKHQNTKMIIAIRHPERINEVLALLKEYSYCRYSELNQARKGFDVLLIDTIGVLDKAYAICDIAIIGGSFFAFGGHNPLEAAFYAKPIVIGEYHSSCKDSVKQLVAANGIVISDKDTLYSDVATLMDDRDICLKLGANAKQVLQANKSALDTQLAAICKYR